MYVYVDWMRCKHCGDTNTLFYASKYRGKEVFYEGCKNCYLDNSREKKRRYYQRNREKEIMKSAEYNRNNPEVHAKHCRNYRRKHREELKEKKRAKKESVIKNTIVSSAKRRVSIATGAR